MPHLRQGLALLVDVWSAVSIPAQPRRCRGPPAQSESGPSLIHRNKMTLLLTHAAPARGEAPRACKGSDARAVHDTASRSSRAKARCTTTGSPCTTLSRSSSRLRSSTPPRDKETRRSARSRPPARLMKRFRARLTTDVSRDSMPTPGHHRRAPRAGPARIGPPAPSRRAHPRTGPASAAGSWPGAAGGGGGAADAASMASETEQNRKNQNKLTYVPASLAD